jgi:hypothetical protein
MATPIETFYKGYRFRSRLEARWAIFFDALGMVYQYEPEGYRLSNGAMYLPDFLVTKEGRRGYGEEHTFWAEVKPEAFTSVELSKCWMLAKETGSHVLLLEGPPDYTSYRLLSPSSVEEFDVTLHSGKNRLWFSPSPDEIYDYTANDDLYHYAVDAALGARFEHGETPDYAAITAGAKAFPVPIYRTDYAAIMSNGL